MGISDDLYLCLSEDGQSDDFMIVDCPINVNDSMIVDSGSEQLLSNHFDIQDFKISYLDSDTDMDPKFSDGKEDGKEESDRSIQQTQFTLEEFFDSDLNPIGGSGYQMSGLDLESYMDPYLSNGVEVNDGSILQTHFFIDEFHPDLNPGSSDSQFFEENVEVGTDLLELGFGLGFEIEDDDYCYDEIIDDNGGYDNRDGFFERNLGDEFVESVELFDPPDSNLSLLISITIGSDTNSGDGQIAPIDFDSIRGSLPAAKSVVQNLPTVILKNAICAVCKGEISLEEEAKCLPCTHHYHGECILPWLGIRNTCPVCRFELPTDDPDYEHWRRQRST